MRLLSVALVVVTALAFLLPLNAADKKKDKKDKPDTPTLNPLDSDKLPAGDYSGKLLTTPGTDGTFTLQIESKHFEPKNPGQLSAKERKVQVEIQTAQQKILLLQAEIVSARTAKDAARHTAELQKETTRLQNLMAQSQLKPSDLKEVTDTKVYDMKVQDKADIRYLNLPQVFDDEGKVKKYSDAELKVLKGKKTNLPGYEGKLEDLMIGQTVKVSLVYVAPKAKPKDTDKADPKADDAVKDDANKADAKKDDPADKAPPEKKMQVKMIVIQQDAPADSTDPKGKKKKNN